MPSERNYYVLCDDNCRFPAMTAEQVLEAIAEATGNVPQHVDDAFITQLKEQNRNQNMKVWIGTQAQYNAIEEPSNDTLYIITDVNTSADLSQYAKKTEVEAVYAKKTEVEAVYAKKTEVEAVYAKKTEVEAVYAKKTEVEAVANKLQTYFTLEVELLNGQTKTYKCWTEGEV